ncbi:Uncharacterized protein TPAR_08280 [Tolypocladium paradoxum]|uniref:Uncharacterized protein n=1 Tax=Tolypocladium paradoxum TaxID=94208 RepID=A0A2S4KMS0_9HYPO|nr:Uncharacterized protein TPAR_08280 [Tolypocladium paradoxum]
MKAFRLFALIAAVGAASSLAAPADGFEAVRRDNLPGLNEVQTSHARAIMGENNRLQLGWQGCVAAITTAITESHLRILANHRVPASFDYWNEGVGADYDSVGIFQQRAQFYPDVGCSMAATCSAGQFFRVMTTVGGWQTMDVAVLCQAVQLSEIPEAYKKYVGMATSICEADGY